MGTGTAERARIEVRLPNEFRTEALEENGLLQFRFHPQVKIPYKEILEANDHNCSNPDYGGFRRCGTTRQFIYDLSRCALPNFTGSFYKFFWLDVDDTFFRLYHYSKAGTQREVSLDLIKDDGEDHLLAYLRINFEATLSLDANDAHACAEKFISISQGNLEAKVVLPFNINIANKEDPRSVYCADISVPIGRALFHGKKLELDQDDNLVRYATVFGQGYYSHIQVANPTADRVKKAVECAQGIKDFFKRNTAPLQTIAGEVWQIIQLQNYKNSIERNYVALLELNGKAKESIPALSKPETNNSMTSEIDSTITSKLEQINKKILPLSEGFPRQVLDYAVRT